MPSLAERKLWFVGIGGAGLSGYAVLAKAWGAEVAGWDRYETPYLEHVRAAGIPVTVSDQVEAAPDGFETVVSTAYMSEGLSPRHGLKSRAEFLAELVSLQDSIVVAGAHGKTTTAGMIAFVLDRLGRDPSFLIGGEISAARRQRAGGVGVARRRGRRVGPDDRAAPAEDRRRHERRPRPSLRVRLARGGRGALRALARRGARGRAGGRARSRRLRARGARRAQPAQCRRGARGARACRRHA